MPTTPVYPTPNYPPTTAHIVTTTSTQYPTVLTTNGLPRTGGNTDPVTVVALLAVLVGSLLTLVLSRLPHRTRWTKR